MSRLNSGGPPRHAAMFLGQRRLWERLGSAWWMMALHSATAHLNSPVITLAVGVCREESALMNAIPTELTGLPRFSSLMLLEANFSHFFPTTALFSYLFLLSHLSNCLTCLIRQGCPDTSFPPPNYNSFHPFFLFFSLSVICNSLRDMMTKST